MSDDITSLQHLVSETREELVRMSATVSSIAAKQDRMSSCMTSIKLDTARMKGYIIGAAAAGTAAGTFAGSLF